MGTAPCIDSRAIAIDGLQARLACLLESLEDGRCGGIRHRINCRTAPHHYSLRSSNRQRRSSSIVCFHSTKADAAEFLLSDFQSHQIGLSAILLWSTGILEMSG